MNKYLNNNQDERELEQADKFASEDNSRYTHEQVFLGLRKSINELNAACDSETNDPVLENCFKSIRNAYAQNAIRIRYLEEENKKLKEEAYRDNELARMKELLEKAWRDKARGFGISEEQEKSIDEWIEKHEIKRHKLKTPHLRMKAQGVSGGGYSYHFYPTALGTSGVIRCYCGAEFEFEQIDG